VRCFSQQWSLSIAIPSIALYKWARDELAKLEILGKLIKKTTICVESDNYLEEAEVKGATFSSLLSLYSLTGHTVKLIVTME